MEEIPVAPVDVHSLADWLQVLAEPKRLFIFFLIMEGFQCNCQLGDILSVPPNLISHHLRALRKAGLVKAQRDPSDARWIYYSINQPALEELYRALGTFFDPTRVKPRRGSCGPQTALACTYSLETAKH